MALGQLLLKLTVPGVPDIYQGDELLNLSLVDPDNRRPVDWEARRAALADPPPKLRVIQRTLALRRHGGGSYEPVDAGPDTVAFLRGGDVFVVGAPARRRPSSSCRPATGTTCSNSTTRSSGSRCSRGGDRARPTRPGTDAS